MDRNLFYIMKDNKIKHHNGNRKSNNKIRDLILKLFHEKIILLRRVN